MQFGPPTSFYGEYRKYSAIVVSVGVSGTISGQIQFLCDTKVIATAVLQPLVGAQVTQVRGKYSFS